MGSRGPVPKRSDQRHGHRSKAERAAVDQAPAAAEVKVPPVSEEWHPLARAWYESLGRSGQRVFYEPSDWATARLIAESLSRDLKPQPVGVDKETGEAVMAVIPLKGASLAAYLKAMASLLVTEADRRRASIELQRPEPSGEGASDVAWIDDARRRLRAAD